VAQSTNLKNQFMRDANTSGVTGVTWDKWGNAWKAQIGGRHLGRFDTLEAAAAARKAAESQLGYTERHGERRSA
jgi:hypothetical protein